MNFRSYLIIGGILEALAGSRLPALAREYFKMDYPPSNNWITYISEHSEPDPNDDMVLATPNGDPNDPNTTLIWVGTRNHDVNEPGCLNIDGYGDDPTTGTVDGALEGYPFIAVILNDRTNELHYAVTSKPLVYNSSIGYEMVDFYYGPVVDYDTWDLADFADNWLRSDCGPENEHCDLCDKNKDGTVNWTDFAMGIGKYWNPNRTWRDRLKGIHELVAEQAPPGPAYWAPRLETQAEPKDPDLFLEDYRTKTVPRLIGEQVDLLLENR